MTLMALDQTPTRSISPCGISRACPRLTREPLPTQRFGSRPGHLRVKGDALAAELVERLLANDGTRGNDDGSEGPHCRHLAHIQVHRSCLSAGCRLSNGA